MPYVTDKNQTGLLTEYETIFNDLKGKEINYLEIGILGGGSLRWARDFFSPQAIVTGIDINIICDPIPGVNLLKVDQADTTGLERLGVAMGLFDIIIDDGSHFADLTQNTFEALFSYLKPGGIYIIEDWAAEEVFPDEPRFRGLEQFTIDRVLIHGGGLVHVKDGGTYAIIKN
jgi:23S rRNA U2552 (ribose-2'-O)-methylase RlmE/FtsJ